LQKTTVSPGLSPVIKYLQHFLVFGIKIAEVFHGEFYLHHSHRAKTTPRNGRKAACHLKLKKVKLARDDFWEGAIFRSYSVKLKKMEEVRK
jgi:hypothetical protein